MSIRQYWCTCFLTDECWTGELSRHPQRREEGAKPIGYLAAWCFCTPLMSKRSTKQYADPWAELRDTNPDDSFTPRLLMSVSIDLALSTMNQYCLFQIDRKSFGNFLPTALLHTLNDMTFVCMITVTLDDPPIFNARNNSCLVHWKYFWLQWRVKLIFSSVVLHAWCRRVWCAHIFQESVRSRVFEEIQVVPHLRPWSLFIMNVLRISSQNLCLIMTDFWQTGDRSCMDMWQSRTMDMKGLEMTCDTLLFFFFFCSVHGRSRRYRR